MKILIRGLTIFSSFSFLYLAVLGVIEITLDKQNQDQKPKPKQLLSIFQNFLCGIFFMVSVCGSQRFSNNFGFVNVSWLKGLFIMFIGTFIIENSMSFYTYFGFMVIGIGMAIFLLSFCEKRSKKRASIELYS